MKIKSNVLFGLIVLICSISGFSLLKRMTREIDEWRPSNLYSSSNIFRRSTYSVVSSAPASYSSTVATVSSGSGSMFRHHGASLYAPALSVSNSQLPMAGTASYGQRLHTTSSAEFRSFGGGGNGGGVSMSGGQVKSSASSVASASGLSVSMPSTSVYAYNTNRNGSSATDVMTSVSGDIAMASSQAYAGIGNTTRGIGGRKNVPSIGGGTSDESVFMNILITICGGAADLTLTDVQLEVKWSLYYAIPSTAPVYWEQFLAWYQSIRTLPATPVGDAVLFVLCCALFYAIYIYVKRKKISVL